MAIYRITPFNPTDNIWRPFPFVEAVWTNARDEHDARTRVSEVAHALNPDLVGPMNCWPWLYFARCAADETPFTIARDDVVDSLGRSVTDPSLNHFGRNLASRPNESTVLSLHVSYRDLDSHLLPESAL